ncbi:TLR adapter interacting with SLC15A4 on the lysosome [Pyxicephalus adspersus]|uniref:Uncharacterized protein n=1 Tax=Pyxicephalus adspersus TaxID=30357 RepID=A0AAV3B6I9_PYXAD|nr:TPA: hypothetical protein GDO54_000984 [Pyxicephalus adspersus]
MLSEGYLCKIQSWYEDGIAKLHPEEVTTLTRERKELAGVCTSNYTFAYETGSRRVFRKYGSVEQKGQGTQWKDTAQSAMETELLQEMENPAYEANKSLPASVNASSQTYLVPSSCKNICRDYNDLHVAGDHVMAINSVMTDYTCEASLGFCEGPFLQSSQIPSAIDSLCVATNDSPKKLSKRGSNRWREGSIKDKSIVNQEQPLSNSILNEYLERKVIELYKQYMMDISCSASPTHIMASELIMNNVEQISMQLSREQNMETNKAKDMVISYLLRLASEKQSNVISTPDLQISSNIT